MVATVDEFVRAGSRIDNIDVRLSYKIVELFSEGLYASPNKAIEELVANSFDAGALNVAVFLPADFHAQGATIGVLDDGEGMDGSGLKQHWLIGISNKRRLGTLPRGRPQIGKFGIGKLASYVLASRLTHITKKNGKFYSTSMDFDRIDKRVDDGAEPKAPIRIDLNELTEKEATSALSPWTNTQAFRKCGLKLFGKGASTSWTFAILSDLKPKVHEIRRGTLEWVLRTALPMRDDFAIFYDGRRLESSKSRKNRLNKWTLGKDISKLPKPAPDSLELHEDEDEPSESDKRFGLVHPELGRITGYAEAYKDLLTGNKSDDLGRSHGFFVYVFGRLINVHEGHFGIQPNELRHGTFGRMRVVIHMDGLDDFLQSDREHVRDGPVLTAAQNVLRGVFNYIRPYLEQHDAKEDPGTKLARKLAVSPASLARRPILEMARAALGGTMSTRYLALPATVTDEDRDRLLAELAHRVEDPERFVAGVEFAYDAALEDGIAAYDVASGFLRVNSLHPFIGAFFEDFTGRTSGLPLEVFAMAEVLLESHLYHAGLRQDQIDDVMVGRDQLLRYVAQESGRRSALGVATALRNARNNEHDLEVEVVEAFRSLGFDATRVGGNGKVDGVAKAPLSPSDGKEIRKYAVALEAKSKRRPGTKVKTAAINISRVARQRDNANCDHAIVVAPAFDHTPGNESALSTEIARDREQTAAAGEPRTITAIHVDDLARLVQLRPVKRVGLARIRELFIHCSLPEECKAWVDEIQTTTVAAPPYAEIIHAINRLQQDARSDPVEYSELRNELKHSSPPIRYENVDELKELCKAMAGMAPREISAGERTVELDQSPENVISAIESATREYTQSMVE